MKSLPFLGLPKKSFKLRIKKGSQDHFEIKMPVAVVKKQNKKENNNNNDKPTIKQTNKKNIIH